MLEESFLVSDFCAQAELQLLHARVRHHGADFASARAALRSAEARIRAVGQWGLWDRFYEVGQEIGVTLPSECSPEADNA